MATGTAKFFNAAKEFGFIAPMTEAPIFSSTSLPLNGLGSMA